jgi:DNA-binding CsgD family transcriptional regulator
MEMQSPDADVTALATGPCLPQFSVVHPPVVHRYRPHLSSLPASPSLPVLAPEPHTVDRQSDHELTILTLIERLGCGCVIVDKYRRIIEANTAAQRILDRTDGSTIDNSTRYQYVLSELIERGGVRLKTGSLIWIATSSKRGVTVALDHVHHFTADLISIIVLLDLDTFPTPNPTTLKLLFGLTFAEARLAFHLAQGRTPNEIAKILRVSRTTIRSQLGAIFSKTHTNRQATLVALLGRIAVLP